MNDSAFQTWQEAVSQPELEIEEIPELTLELARVLYGHYCDLSIDGTMPTRKDLNPACIPTSVLASVYLLEPIDDYQDWLYRLIGTEVVNRFQIDRTGQSLRSFLSPECADGLIAHSNRAVREERPIFFRLLPRGTAMEYFYAETMSLPVIDPRAEKIWLFGGTFFGDVVVEQRC